MIEVSGEVTEQDYLQAQSFHVKTQLRKPLGLALRAAVTLILAGYLLITIAAVAGGIAIENPFALLWWLVPGVIVVLVVVSARFTRRRVYRRQRSLRGTHRYVISADGLQAASDHGEGRHSWSAYVRWAESPEIFLLYQADNLFHMLPKRWFGGDEALIEALRGLLRERVG